MRKNKKNQGFTLIELLIVIAIIGILAAVLIPNLLNARARAFDTAAQTCLREIGTLEEMEATTAPWTYSNGSFAGTPHADTGDNSNDIEACTNVTVVNIATGEPDSDGDDTLTAGVDNFGYSAIHTSGSETYYIRNGGGVTTTNPFL